MRGKYGLGLVPLYWSVFAMRLSFSMVVLTLPLYIGPKWMAVGVVSAAYPLAEVLTIFFFGLLADRHGVRPVLSYGLLLSSAAILGFTLTKETGALAALHAAQGLAAAAVMASSLAFLAGYASRETVGREMGVFDFANLAGYAMGLPIGGLIADFLPDIRASFVLASALALTGFIISRAMLPELPPAHEQLNLADAMKAILLNPKSLALLPLWLTIMILLGIALSFAPLLFTLMVEAAGESGILRYLKSFPATSIAAGMSVVALILGVTQPFFGKLSDKYGRLRMLYAGSTSIAAFLAVSVLYLKGYLGVRAAVALGAVFGLGSLTFSPAGLALLAELAPRGREGATMGLYSLVMSLGTLIGPLIGGHLLEAYGESAGLAALLELCLAMVVASIAIGASLYLVSERRRVG